MDGRSLEKMLFAGQHASRVLPYTTVARILMQVVPCASSQLPTLIARAGVGRARLLPLEARRAPRREAAQHTRRQSCARAARRHPLQAVRLWLLPPAQDRLPGCVVIFEAAFVYLAVHSCTSSLQMRRCPTPCAARSSTRHLRYCATSRVRIFYKFKKCSF